MSEPDLTANTFLARSGWSDVRLEPLAGDASARRYFRLTRPDGARAVLMDTAGSATDQLSRFLAVGDALADRGLSVPAILSADLDAGFALIEDLGDCLFTHEIQNDEKLEPTLYRAATNVILHLRGCAVPDELPVVDADHLCRALDVTAAYWCGSPGSQVTDAMRPYLGRLPDARSFVHRDYHADNLIWLPQRDGIARVGVLDFQDAIATHPAYDLVSLLQDARRDVGPETVRSCYAQYLDRSREDPDTFFYAYAVLGVQRHLRILGVFARLSKRDGKTDYLRFADRVWDHLQTSLTHPDLAGLRREITRMVPAPSTGHLVRLGRA